LEDTIMRSHKSPLLLNSTHRAAALRLLLVGATLFIGFNGALAQEPKANLTMKDRALAEGKTDYIVYCQACHGRDGKGGSMAAILVKRPTDLTKLSTANDGTFPFWRVFGAVAGDSAVAGHDTFQMPEFWRRFQREDGMPGYAPASLRILALTHYVESLQVR
jgi:mono/diheme cytochrome c family protein